MTLAHISDTHLGFRAYGRTTPEGVNQREVDVMRTFRSALETIAQRDPDVVVHSGDMFHVVRPSNNTVVAAFKAIESLQRRRQGKPMVIIGGNHDTPRTSDAGNILKLFACIDGVYVVTDRLEVLEFPELDLEVMCVPDNSLRMQENIEYAPTLPRKHGVLVLHGVDHQLIRTGVGDLDIAETRHDRWTYVALGDFHVHKAYAPNTCYSGSTDYTSTNIWEEGSRDKGWAWFDTEVAKLELIPVSTRRVIDLPKIDASRLEPPDVEKRLLKNADWEPDEMPIVRQRVVNAHPSLRGKLQQTVIREVSSRALHYQIDITPPAASSAVAGSDARAAGKTLGQSWDDHMVDTQSVPPGVNRIRIQQLGHELLKEVEHEVAETTA